MLPDESMMPDEIEEIFHERAANLWNQWWEERKENPSYLNIIMDTPLNPGMRVVVESLSQKYMDCQPGDENYLQWSAALIDEIVTPITCEKLNIVLDTISGFQGTSAHESMAYLTFLYVVHVDMQRAAEREASILFTDRCEQYDDFYRHKENIAGDSLPPEQAGPASWRLDQVLDFWYAFGGKFARGFPVPNPKAVGRWCYFKIPPVWLPLNVLEELNKQLTRIGRNVEPIKIPALVEATRKNLWESLDETWQECAKQDLPMPFGIGNAIQENQAARSGTPEPVQEQEKSQSELRISSDGRSVNLRGEVFSLTPTQARVFELLYDAYTNGTPDLSETYIIDILGLEKGKVKDIFKRKHNWQRLITKGKDAAQDTFRLNIDS